MRRLITPVVLLVLSLGSATISYATTISYNSLLDWQAAVNAGMLTVTLEEFLPLSGPDQQRFTDLGYRLDTGQYVETANATSAPGVWAAQEQETPINITFFVPGTDTPMTVFGVTVSPANEGTTELKAFDKDGNLLDTTSGDFGIGGFLGLTSTEGIARVEVDHTTVGNTVFDDLRFTIPEPGTAATLAVAGLGMTTLRRRTA